MNKEIKTLKYIKKGREVMKDFEPYKKPTSVEKVVATIRVDLKTLEEIDKLAGKIDISRNELINQCIEYALENLKSKGDTDKKEND